MEELETSLFQTRKAHRIEQMVARWLRRSRDSSARAKVAAADGPARNPTQTFIPVRHTVKIDKDTLIQDYGFHISESLPLTVVAVTAGGSAHGKLFPGDQILQMNNEPAEDLSWERAVDILREAEDSLSITVVRCTSGVPKSSFLTEEKRARLKTNPVKVHFAEEVLISGHSQGNSLLCMPNVLKLYLENGQTKAFKFEANTTVKDIILTVKEKLSIRSIEYFALALEEQYSISRLHLLHEEELIQQVVEREESHDYRCLFRVCFVPKDPLDLLKEDPVAFEYLYLQSCSDVLQERFAVEMKCSSALRLAALHIQERIYACAQPQKISLKYIEKDWGIENFISPTLLRNMKGKDIKKAISFHMKRNQNLLEPRQKQLISAAQLRLNYLQILGELKTYGGRIFNATLMLQDRESYIALLVGAKYGISQIINSKLNIMATLAEFANISRVELTEESEKVSVVKVYLQDVKVLTLLLESNSAKDLACLIAGYYRLLVDPVTSIFLWPGNKQQVHRVSAEEGPRDVSAAEPSATSLQNKASTSNPENSLPCGPDGRQPSRRGGVKKYAKTLRKRRSFLQTDYTSQVSFPLVPSASLESVDDVCYYDREPYLALGAPSPTVSSLQDMQGEPGLLETKALGLLAPLRETKSTNPASRVMEMEPETMETKSVIDSRVSSISAIRFRIDPNNKENSDAVPVASSSASTPHCSNPGSSGPDTAQARPSQILSLSQDLDGTAPKEPTIEHGDSSFSLSSGDPNPDRACLASHPGLNNISQGDTLELQLEPHVQLEMGLESFCTNHIQETAPKYTEPLLSPRDEPRSDECGINPGEKIASIPTKEEQQGQLSLQRDREVTNKNGTNIFQEESRKDSGDSPGNVSNNVSQALRISSPAGKIVTSLSLDAPVTGTEQIPPHPPRDPQGQSREPPGQACQAQEQKLFVELDLDPGCFLGKQTISSALPPEGIKAEAPDHVTGEDIAPRDSPEWVCFNPEPSLPEPLPCPQEDPHLETSNHCLFSEGKSDSSSICLSAEKSFLCFAPESHPEVSASLRMATSLGFAGMNEMVAPRIGMDQCSCQFSYATCFRGPQPETEEEDRDLEAHPMAPLTSPPSAGSPVVLPWRPARPHSCSTAPLSRKSHIWPEYCSRALRQLKATPASTPEGFIQLMESLLELQDILETSWGIGNKHPPEKCTWHFTESRSRLCMGSQKLLSSCQHVIRMDQSPEEMQGAVRDTFQHLVQLAGLCFQFTDCSRCSARNREAVGNLRDVVYTYHQFVEAAKSTCERGYHDLSVKLLARQCTALTAAVFCLTQKFRASTAL
ncbi:FERM and PDZ domain-containing protein 1 isoform X2 [Symphalangus syndactylus]|uniref:FERM and PDZ domain-containing protein 1 isoform X2 n=1 Tax=Symphalangus syndactylus TaxID=9590 RepID=UPI002442137A|nr:FERM and PDZ domain-containing protein 1 isoform X3 [Symphalangus syndactylus]